MTILISSHLLGEIEKMVSHVGIIFKGKNVVPGYSGRATNVSAKGLEGFY